MTLDYFNLWWWLKRFPAAPERSKMPSARWQRMFAGALACMAAAILALTVIRYGVCGVSHLHSWFLSFNEKDVLLQKSLQNEIQRDLSLLKKQQEIVDRTENILVSAYKAKSLNARKVSLFLFSSVNTLCMVKDRLRSECAFVCDSQLMLSWSLACIRQENPNSFNAWIGTRLMSPSIDQLLYRGRRACLDSGATALNDTWILMARKTSQRLMATRLQIGMSFLTTWTLKWVLCLHFPLDCLGRLTLRGGTRLEWLLITLRLFPHAQWTVTKKELYDLVVSFVIQGLLSAGRR